MTGAVGGWLRLAAQGALVGVDPRLVLYEPDPFVRHLWADVIARAWRDRQRAERGLAHEIAAAVGKLFRRRR